MTEHTDNLNERLSGYLDGELTADESAEIDRRLADSPELRADLDGLAEIKRRVGSLPRMAAPPAIRDRVREALERRSLLTDAEPSNRPARRWFRLTRVAAAAAMLLAAVTLAFTVWRHINPAGERPPRPLVSNGPGEHIAVSPPAPDSAMDRLADGRFSDRDLGGEPLAVRREGRARPGDSPFDGKVGDVADKAGQPDSPAAESTLGKTAEPDPGWIHDAARGGRAIAGLRDRVDGRESLKTQLSRGPIKSDQVFNLRFESEGEELLWPVSDAAELEQVSTQIRQMLTTHGASPVEQLGAGVRLTPDDHQFYYQGRASTNYDQTTAKQEAFVVRVRPAVAEKLRAQAVSQSQGQAVLFNRDEQVAARTDIARQVESTEETVEANSIIARSRGREQQTRHSYVAEGHLAAQQAGQGDMAERGSAPAGPSGLAVAPTPDAVGPPGQAVPAAPEHSPAEPAPAAALPPPAPPTVSLARAPQEGLSGEQDRPPAARDRPAEPMPAPPALPTIRPPQTPAPVAPGEPTTIPAAPARPLTAKNGGLRLDEPAEPAADELVCADAPLPPGVPTVSRVGVGQQAGRSETTGDGQPAEAPALHPSSGDAPAPPPAAATPTPAPDVFARPQISGDVAEWRPADPTTQPDAADTSLGRGLDRGPADGDRRKNRPDEWVNFVINVYVADGDPADARALLQERDRISAPATQAEQQSAQPPPADPPASGH